WKPEDCLNRMAAFSMTGNAFRELQHAQLVGRYLRRTSYTRIATEILASIRLDWRRYGNGQVCFRCQETGASSGPVLCLLTNCRTLSTQQKDLWRRPTIA